MSIRSMTGQVLACASAACMASAFAADYRPASEAERSAAGIEETTAIVMVREPVVSTALEAERTPQGGAFSQWLTRPGIVFAGINSEYAYSGEPPSMQCPSGGTEVFATTTLDLPESARITFIDVFGYDNSASDNVTLFLISACQNLGEAFVYTVLGEASSSGTPGNTVFTLNFAGSPVDIDRYRCRYLARVRMASGVNGPCVGGALFLDKARVEYTVP